MANKVVTIDSCIRSAIIDIGAGMERFEQFKNWAIEGYKELHFDVIQEIKTVQLDLTAWKAIELPTDFVDWVMIGSVVDYQIRVFTNDNRISLYHDDLDPVDGDPDARDGDNSDPVDTTANQLYFWNTTNQYGEDTGQLYGMTVKHNGQGYFKLNNERNEIQFSPAIDGDTKIYLEYISNGYDASVATAIHEYAGRCIKRYIHWQRLLHSKSSPLWERREAERLYYVEYNKVVTRLNKITVEDVLDCARDAYRLVGSI